MNTQEFPLCLSDKEAEKLVLLIKNGSVRSGILVFKSLAATLTYRKKVKDDMKIEKFLGIKTRK